MLKCFHLFLLFHINDGCNFIHSWLWNRQTVYVTGHVGQSVLLPCSCSEAKPHTFRWIFHKESDGKEIFPKDQTNRYTHRVQLFNDHHPGNLSLLISHLTVEDGGWYRCQISNNYYKDVSLSVKEATMRPSTLPSKTKPTSTPVSPESLPFVPFAVVAVIFLHIIVAVVYWRTRKKGPDRAHYNRTDGDEVVGLQKKRTS